MLWHFLLKLIKLPNALFACELWNSVSASDMAKLESTHHMCLKHAQNHLPHLTRSDMVTGLLGFTSIQAHIDTLKLLLFTIAV